MVEHESIQTITIYKKNKKIESLERTYHKLIADSEGKYINFRIPKIVRQALKDSIKAESKKIHVSSYYLELIGFDFYRDYLIYFEAVLNEEIAKKGSLALDDLPSSPISKNDFHQVVKNGYKDNLTSRNCPAIILKVVQHLHTRLDYGDSTSKLFRKLTLPIVIKKMKTYIDYHLST